MTALSRLLSLVLVSSLLTLAACSSGAGSTAVPSTDLTNRTVVQAAQGVDELSMFVELVQEAGLAQTLATTDNITVFAPSNEAFERLDDDFLQELRNDEDMLRSVLQYHVVEDRLTADELAEIGEARADAAGPILSSMYGADITVTSAREGLLVGDAAIMEPNLLVSNGIVHIVDKVLVPSGMDPSDAR